MTEKPEPPIGTLEREGDIGKKCNSCGSSLKLKYLFFKTKYCIHPKCSNYWKQQIKENIMIEKHINLLGTQMKDVVTGISGMVDSISFDAYGCVQATLKGRINEEGKIPEAYWFDVKRLIPDGKRIMPVPEHLTTPPGKENGPASKPAFTQLLTQ